MNYKKQRDVRLDIIRIFSFFCVVSIHFFLNSGFYYENVNGFKMLIMCIIRSFFIISVPMFIILTGYLMNKKELSKKYYKGIIKILIIYILCSIVYSLFSKFYQRNNMNLIIFFKNILAYSGTPYAWYVEMYIGLFLLIPFLNIIFNNLRDKKQANILLITLVFIIGLPSILNIFKFNSLEWWFHPVIDNAYSKIFPSWWSSIYPIFYYFLGAYLKRYPIKISANYNFVLLFLTVALDGLFNFYRSYGGRYVYGTWNDYSSAFIMIISFLTFNLLLKIKLKENKVRDNVLKTLSDACLGAYLISYCYDYIFYNYLNQMIINVKDRFIYAPIIVILVFSASIITSMLINYFYKIVLNGILKIKKKEGYNNGI